MGLDMDIYRDDAAAFGPASFLGGGILPYEGRVRVMHPDAWEDALRADTDGWLSPSSPVLVRGGARILPLAWLGDPHSDVRSVTGEEIAAFASEMQAAGINWAGYWDLVDLSERRADSIGSYNAALRAAGATRVDAWTYSKTVGFALVWTGEEGKGTMSLALHVVPTSWVSESRATKPVRGIEVAWSWLDVIDLYMARIGSDASDTAD